LGKTGYFLQIHTSLGEFGHKAMSVLMVAKVDGFFPEMTVGVAFDKPVSVGVSRRKMVGEAKIFGFRERYFCNNKRFMVHGVWRHPNTNRVVIASLFA
jgi:hypothetical protein